MGTTNGQLDYDLEPFVTTGQGHKKRISIRKSGQIGINVGAVKEYDLKQYEGFIFHYSREDKVVGLEPTDDKSRPGFITAREHNEEIQVSAKSFFDHYDIPYDETRRAPVLGYNEDMGKHGMVLADISEVMQHKV